MRSSHEIKTRFLTRSLARGLAAISAALLGSVLVLVAPASAQQIGSRDGDRVWSLPTAPRGAEAAVAAAAASPSISPAASRVRHFTKNEKATCPSGNLCAAVWDPTISRWKVFDLYYCNRYYLSNWLGDGGYYNAQTGGVRFTFYAQNGNVLRSSTSTGAFVRNWDAVWSIRNC
ncbi:hypothetical protein KIF24_18565 [Micromonospora sp. Llam7]|uniref:hypothetical protein n=1 Tax=Micromonospora tarapacensis TaxID=2835305 RepID=UPI001C840A73|nr:hypothetical protein [Micromonospora tarapacensis]MBX7267842.1 hypothetical protein [Micromonospora tarapacensis]